MFGVPALYIKNHTNTVSKLEESRSIQGCFVCLGITLACNTGRSQKRALGSLGTGGIIASHYVGAGVQTQILSGGDTQLFFNTRSHCVIQASLKSLM